MITFTATRDFGAQAVAGTTGMWQNPGDD